MLETEVKICVFAEENLSCTILKEQGKMPTTIQVPKDDMAERKGKWKDID